MLKVLVVDDDVAIRLFLRKVLKDKLGQIVLEAQDGLEALDIIQKENPDLLMIDIAMPIMDGLELLAMVREDPNYQNIPVIILTGQKERGTVQKIVELGVSAYLLKPIEYSKALLVLDKVFQEIHSNPIVLNRNRECSHKKKIVVIDKDPEFNLNLINKFGEEFQMYYFDNGKDGFTEISKIYPDFVFICERLGMINESIIAQKIKNLDDTNHTKVFLCVDEKKEMSETYLYDDVLLKTTPIEKIEQIITQA